MLYSENICTYMAWFVWLTHHGGQVHWQTRGVVGIGAEDLPADFERLLRVVLPAGEEKMKKNK